MAGRGDAYVSPDSCSGTSSALKFLLNHDQAGLLIGKAGQTVGAIQDATGVHVKLSQSHVHFPGTPDRVALITGPFEGTVAAMHRIVDLIAAHGTQLPGVTTVAPSDPAAGSPDAAVAIRLAIPTNASGAVIGRGGGTIRVITNASGARVQMAAKEAPARGVMERLVTLSGTRAQVVAGVREVLAQFAGSTNHAYHNLTTAYPRHRTPSAGGGEGDVEDGGEADTTASSASGPTAGSSAGPAASSPRGVSARARAGTPADPVPGADAPESEGPGVMVQDALADEGGSGAVVAPLTTGQDAAPTSAPPPAADAVGAPSVYHAVPALRAYAESVAAAVSRGEGQGEGAELGAEGPGAMPADAADPLRGFASPTPVAVTLRVPNGAVGRIVGKGGIGISRIEQYTGARVQLSCKSDFVPGTTDRRMTLSGRPAQVHAAHILVRRQLEYAARVGAAPATNQ